VGKQGGFGWGKGRLVIIKTTHHADPSTPTIIDDVHVHEGTAFLEALRRANHQETEELQAENRTLKRRLRMAKAELPLDPHGAA
jgi:hypothetical protein